MPALLLKRQARALPQKCQVGSFITGATALLLLLAGSRAVASTPIAATKTALQAAIKAAKSTNQAVSLAREDFLRLAPITDVKLSPDGRYLVYRQRDLQQTDLMCRDLLSGTITRLLADVRQLSFEWADQSRQLWLADQQGLAVYSFASHNVKRVFKWDEKRQQRFWGVDANAPSYALVREKIAESGSWRYRALLVDANGQQKLLLAAPQPLRGVLLNRDGSLAYATRYDGPGFDTVVLRYDAASSSAQEILRCVGAEQCNLLEHDENQNTVWLLSHQGEDRSALKRWQADAQGQGRWQREFSDPDQLADVASVFWQQNRKQWLGIAFHPDRRHWYGRDDMRSQQLNALQKQLPDASLSISASNDGERWLVQAKHAQWELDRYFLYSPSNAQLQVLFAAEYQTVKSTAAEQLAAAVPLHYLARDGLLVHGYVYLPLGKDPAKVPLLAHIHGGPFNRDRDHYNALVQLLVNRGYAVFTPNFRASTGFGRRHLLAPNGDFANAGVLHDILDGMDFLLANGIGDRAKQAVSGHSFGAYASLLAVSHNPERFRFAVASAAPVDFNWVMQYLIENGGSALPEDSPPGEIFLRHHGLRFDDKPLREKMRRESPLSNVAQLRSSIYLWAGAKDDRVALKSLTHYASDASRQNKKLTLLIDPQSGHYPDAELNLEALVYLLEASAGNHFGGAVTPPSPALQTFLDKNIRIDTAGLATVSEG